MSLPKPYYQDDWCTIYHGDCREVMPELGRFDLLLTDPPYGIKHKSSWGSSWQGTEIANDHSTELRDWAWEHVGETPRAAFGMSWKKPPPPGVRAVLIWDKLDTGSGDLTFPWKPSWEEIYIAGEGWRGTRDRGVLRGPVLTTWETIGSGRNHPHEKPVWLMARILGKAPFALTIFDPFMGSGTTLVAAKNLNRRAVGIELEERYCEIAAHRLSQEVFRFEEPPQREEQEAFGI